MKKKDICFFAFVIRKDTYPIFFKILVLLMLAMESEYLHAQSLVGLKKDSLFRMLDKVDDVNQEIDILNELAFINRQKSTEALGFANKALLLAKEVNNEKGKGDALVRLGLISKKLGDFESSEEYYLQALAIRKGLGDQHGMIGIYSNLAVLFRYRGKFEEALKYYQIGLDFSDGQSMLKGRLLNGISACFIHLGDYQNALLYTEKSIRIRELIGDNLGAANSLLTSGNIYLRLKNYSAAEKEYMESLKLFKINGDSIGTSKLYISLGILYSQMGEHIKSLEYYHLGIKQKEFISVFSLVEYYENIGDIYMLEDKADMSLLFYSKSKALSESMQDSLKLIETNYKIARLHTKREEYEEALEDLNKSLDLIKVNGVSSPILKAKIISLISECYEGLGEYLTAIKWKNQYSLMQDSLNNLILQAANYKSNSEQKQRDLERIASEMKIQRLEKMKLIYFFSGIILLFVSGSTILLNGVRQKRQKQRLGREIDDLLRDQAIENSYARIEIQDRERQRIAQELHDRLGSMLSTIKLYFSTLKDKIDQLQVENQEQYYRANQLLDEACEEVRQISHNLHSGILKKFGLKAQLEELANTIDCSKQIKVEVLTYKIPDRLSTKMEIHIYRIIQELISNVLRHAKASELSLQVNRFGNIIHILIEDNGIGVKDMADFKKGGMGLNSVKTRVLDLSGSIEIDSVVGRGTSISIDIPLSSK